MSLGGLMGLLGIPLPGVEVGIAVSAIVLGAMVLGEVRPSLSIAAAIVAFFAVFHGHAHGRELPEGASALLYSLGFVVATGLLHAVGIVLGVAHRWSTGRQAVRLAGGGVALAGLIFLWRAIA
jgi:urease accessory protein